MLGAIMQNDAPIAACEHAMWALGTTAGVEVNLNCDDYMSTCRPDDQTKSWEDDLASCGYFDASPCRCGGGGSNSFDTLIDAYGASCE